MEQTEAENITQNDVPIRQSIRIRKPLNRYRVWVNSSLVLQEPIFVQDTLSGEETGKWKEVIAS